MTGSVFVEDIASKHCVSCEHAEPLSFQDVQIALKRFSGWKVADGMLQKEFRFKTYLLGLEFAYSLGKIAEIEDHHPDIAVGWRRVTVRLSTHTIKGLSENDFIMAAKTELEYNKALRARGPNDRSDK